MTFLRWSPELELPVESLNAQHRALIDAVDRLDRSLGQENPARVSEMLVFLVGYVAEHFSDEERLMERHGYPDLDAHRLEHHKLSARVQRYVDAYLDGQRVEHRELLDFLRAWLLEHIDGSDRRAAEHCARRRQSAEFEASATPSVD